MKAKPPTPSPATQPPPAADPIGAYAVGKPADLAAICHRLREEIDAALPKATPKIWHAMPVWFIGENPVVGYKVSAKKVTLLFWNGQAFGGEFLKPLGQFRAAQTHFATVDEIDVQAVRRCLKAAKKDIWDYAGMYREMRSGK